MRGTRHNKEQIIGDFETGRRRAEDSGGLPPTWDHGGNPVPLESQVWGYGGERRQEVAAIGGGEPEVEALGGGAEVG